MGFKLDRNRIGDQDMAWFPWVENGLGAGGSLVYYPKMYKPSAGGVLGYLTALPGDLSNELSRVEAAGGQVLQTKRLISEEHGYMAVFIDSEGNRIAIHSRK